MRLQLEARDAASSMQRGSVHDLTERLAEAQRELQRSRQSAQDGQNMVEVLQRDLQEAEVTTQALRNELAQAQTACLDTERRLGAERAALLGSKDEEVTRLLESTAELKSSRDSLLAEMESLRKEKAVGDAALKSLDEYKRKAQAALKKVKDLTLQTPAHTALISIDNSHRKHQDRLTVKYLY